MQNAHTLIVGRTGSGKTTLAAALLRRTARAIVLDRQWENAYEFSDLIAEGSGEITYEFDEFAHVFLMRRWEPFTIVFRGEDPADYTRVLQLAEHTQKVEPHGPLVIALEEASQYSDTHNMDDVVRNLFNAGRHRRISMLTIIQVDTDIHRVTRHNAKIIVSMNQTQLSSRLAGKFDETAVAKLRGLDQGYTPEPVQGEHFLVYPPNVDLYEEWTKLHGWIVEEIPNQQGGEQ